MCFVVLVPEPIQNEISAWKLSPDGEDELYRRLDVDLVNGPEGKCVQLAAPSPTYVYEVTFRDPENYGIVHTCTFWLTYGPRDKALYVQHCAHEEEERWGSEDDEWSAPDL